MNTTPTESAVLSRDEACRRALLLTDLRDALAKRSVEALVVTRRRVVLRADFSGGPSGPTDPALYVFLDGTVAIATTDGTNYQLADGVLDAVSDPDAAARAIAGRVGRRVLLPAAV